MQPERRPGAVNAVFLVTFAALLPLLSKPVSAQPSQRGEPAPWYRVEILVFRQPGPSGFDAEAWDPEPGLAYPARHRHLIDRKLADARLQAYPGSDSHIDERGQQRLQLPAPQRGDIPPLGSPTDAAPLGQDIPLPSGISRSPGASATQAAAGSDDALPGPTPIGPVRADAQLDVDDPDIPLPPPAAYTLLPERFRELNRDAARMRSSGYGILMHATWVQPMADEKDARAVILDRSGDPDTSSWPALQGSVTIHLSRYLHVATRLWLNTDGDYLHPAWRMPEPARAPPSLTLAMPALDDWYEHVEDGTSGLEATLRNGSHAREQLAREADLPDTGSADVRQRTDSDYPWRHAILLEQSRRMRGGELHYIDHPVLGVLIKMTLLEDQDWRDTYRETQDWAWEDRHNVIIDGQPETDRLRDSRR